MRVADLTSSRELLWNLTLRDLRGKYKRSTLGWAWSMLNPLATMVVYTLVFGKFLKGEAPSAMANGHKVFAFFLLCALLPWNFVSQATTGAMASLLANGGLVKKVWFPRENIIFSTVGALAFSLLIEMSLLCVALVVAGNLVLPWMPVMIALMALLVLFVTGIALLLSALNVYLRDLSYLWSVFTQLWFFATPIVYSPKKAEDYLGKGSTLLRLYEANPMAVFSRAFRAVLYDLRWPTLSQVAYLVAVTAITLTVGLWAFAKLSPRFAEEF